MRNPFKAPTPSEIGFLVKGSTSLMALEVKLLIVVKLKMMGFQIPSFTWAQ